MNDGRVQGEVDGAESPRGRLKIYLGAAAGVGKTYAMLEAAHRRQAEGVDVVVGCVETHGREETEALLPGLEIIPRRTVLYRGIALQELDLDAVLARRPQLVLVDELAHTNAPGSRHHKRYQDVRELLAAGIDVYTTLNIQHIESLNDVVAQITGTKVRETVPDRIFDRADEVELVDLPPEELIRRLEEGKVYGPETAERATRQFFRPGNLIALREMALRRTAERVDREMRAYMTAHGIRGPWPAGERVMVCVGPSPMWERLIRMGRRIAAYFDADWVAVHVETPADRNLTSAQRDRIRQAMQLAEAIGGSAVTLSGSDVAAEIIHYARTHNITRLIIGKPLRPRWADFFRGDLVDRIIRESMGIDVHVISASDGWPKENREDSTQGRFSWRGYAASLTIVAFATILGWAASGHIDPVNLVMLYLLGVVISGLTWGRGPAVLSSVLGVLAFDFFLVPPRLSFAVYDLQYLISFASLMAVALVVGTQTGRLKGQVEVSRRREAETAALYAFSRSVVAARDLEEIAQAIIKHGRELFHQSTAILLPVEGRLQVYAAAPDFEPDENEMAAAVWTFTHGQPAGRGEGTLSGVGAHFQPLKTANGVIGVLATRAEGARREGFLPMGFEEPANTDRKRLFEAFAAQVAVAVERARLAEKAQEARLLAEADRLHTTLLNSISHDLRTPLATIIGALTTLSGQGGQMAEDDWRELVETAREGAERMNRLVGDLLDMTRLESGSLKLVLDWYDLEDIVGTALDQAAESLKGRPVNIDLPADLPLVRLDPVLVGQVLSNLLENAAKYSAAGQPIDIWIRRVDGEVSVSVADRGPGVPPELRERIFDKFYRVDRQGHPSGTGLGLSICKGIVEAHHGRIGMEPREGGGSVFTFILPIGSDETGR